MHSVNRGGSRTAATSKMELFVIIVNGWKPLTIITKYSILDVAEALDLPLVKFNENFRLALCIDMNTEVRKNAKKLFQKRFFQIDK